MDDKLIKVRALTAVYYGERYHRAGDVLLVRASDVNEKIHELVDAATPEHITSSNEAIAQERAVTLASRTQDGQAAAPDPPTGAADVLAGDAKGKK